MTINEHNENKHIQIADILFCAGIVCFGVSPFAPSSWLPYLIGLGGSLIGTTLLLVLPTQISLSERNRLIVYGLFLFLEGTIFGLILSLILPQQVEKPEPYPISDGTIADFSTGGGGPARHALGGTFSITSDSEWNGKSKCWYELKTDMENDRTADTNQNKFLRFYYELIPRDKSGAEAYVGIFAGFSFPPAKPYDCSKFSHLSFRMRIPEQKILDNAFVYIALPTDNPPKTAGMYDWCEYEIPSAILKTSWTNVRIPFSSFKAAGFSSQNRIFDPARIFQVVIAIRSTHRDIIHGHLDIDDIRFEL